VAADTKTDVVAVRVSPTDKKKLEALSRQMGEDKSTVLRTLLRKEYSRLTRQKELR
jgi:hypothetical protein